MKHLSYRASAEVKVGGTEIVSGKKRTVGNWRTVEKKIYTSWETNQKSSFLKCTKSKKRKTQTNKKKQQQKPPKIPKKAPPKKQQNNKLSLKK